MRPAVVVGIGAAGSLDEIVLHQLLRWHHHLYDRGSQAAGLIADGIFHLGSTTALGIGLVLMKRWRTGRGPLRQAAAGILVGAGGFNLYDGIIQHKLLSLHQVRTGAPKTFPTAWCLWARPR
jgi:uncharacterized membrane protein